MQRENWAIVKGFDKYMVSDRGRVFSQKNRKILKKICGKDGYEYVVLYDNKISKRIGVHRLVALAFIPRPANKNEVNHKNGIKMDNNVNNLEWTTRSENVKHTFSVLGRKPSGNGGKKGVFNSCSKRVLQIQDNKVIGRYYGCCEASRETGVCRQNISSCCNHKYNTAGGFIWKFED